MHLITTLTSVAVLASSAAMAHATLVFGTVSIDPSPALGGVPTALSLVMNDPAGTPIEDAIVRVEVGRDDADAPAFVASFTAVAPGRYDALVTFPSDGTWTLRFRDTTFRQEEARAIVTLRVGPEGDAAPPSFIFPPTATGPRSMRTWLFWMIGLPLLAAAIVTVTVLRQPVPDAFGDEDDASDTLGAPGDPRQGTDRPA